MSLEELRAQAETEEATTNEAEEPETQDEPEPEAVEPEDGSSDEEDGAEAETAEVSEDFELELDGEPEPGQQKPSPEEALVYKLTKQKQRTKEYKSKVEELEDKLAELQSQVSGTHAPQAQPRQQVDYPAVPLLYENGIDTPEQYQKAYQKWVADCKAIDQRNAEADQKQTEHKRRMEDMTRNLAQRVGKFAAEHKIKDDRVVGAIERATSEVDGATRIEGSLAYLLDSVGDGGERVAYYIGTNDMAMSKVKQLLQEDPNGLKAIAHMTRLADKLKPKHSKSISKAPEPDQPLRGDGSSKSAHKLQEEYDKASNAGNLQAMRKARRKAEELGVNLK